MTPRPIPQFTRVTETARVRECYECRERITWGQVKREVLAIGARALEVRFFHYGSCE